MQGSRSRLEPFGIDRPTSLHSQEGPCTLDEGQERGEASVGLATSLRISHALIRQEAPELMEDPAFADSGFADDRDEPSVAVPSSLAGPKEGAHLPEAAHKGREAP